MRVVALVKGGCLALLLAACSSAGAGESTSTTVAIATTPVATNLVTVGPTAAPTSTVPLEQIENCVKYVPFAASQDDPYMKMTWAAAGEDPVALRAICEELGHTNPQSLAYISEQQKALDQWFGQFTTTVPGQSVPPPVQTVAPVATTAPPAVATTAPPLSTVSACPKGSHLSEDGFCVVD